MASIWSNQDGLVVRFGTKKAGEENRVPATERGGVVNVTKLRIKGEDLADTCTFAADTLSERSLLPARIYVKSATIVVLNEAFAGATAVLDVGTYNADGTAIADGGLDAGVTQASLTADAVIVGDGTQVGAVVEGTGGIRIGASYDTAAFTAGEAEITVEWIDATGGA